MPATPRGRHDRGVSEAGADEAAAAAAPRVTLRLFAAAREAAGQSSLGLSGSTLGSVLETAVERFGGRFADVLAGSKVWVNGEPAGPAHRLADGDEVAVLPPVSGGSGPLVA